VSWPEYLLLLVVGVIAGAVNAIAGGGTLLMLPALVGTGLPTKDASVTNSVALWPGYVGNALGLGPIAREQARQRWLLGVIAVAGALCGSLLLLIIPGAAVDLIVPFLVLGASLLLAAQPWLKRRFGAGADEQRSVLVSVCVFGVGLYGGFFQGALGVILMAVLGVAMAVPLQVVNALKGLLQVAVVSTNVVVFALFGPVHWLAALVIAPASLAGGVLGGRFARSVDENVLRRCVVVVGILVAIWMGVRAIV
jgi:uncharacterized membrane protein YfcA